MFESDLKALRLARDCGPEEVRRAYVRLTRRYPPEHFPERFKKIKQAHERLSLEPSHLESKANSIRHADSPLEVFDAMLEEALDLVLSEKREDGLPQQDVRELEPVLNAARYREELFTVLQRIADKGFEYKDAPSSDQSGLGG